MEVVDNPFEESTNSNMIIKVKEVDIFINKNILQKREAQTTNAVNKDESIVIEIINGKEWLIKIMDNYSAENVIRFFKFIIPGFIVQLNEDDNFRTMLSLCEELKVNWLKKSIEKYLQQRISSKLSVFQFSIQFSLAEKFNLHELKTSLETEFIESFVYSKKDDFLVIAEMFDLKTALVMIEEKLLLWMNNLSINYSEKIGLLRLAEKYHLYNLQRKLILCNYTKSCLQMEDFSKLSTHNSFEITKKALEEELKQRFIFNRKIDSIVELAEDVYYHFSKKKRIDSKKLSTSAGIKSAKIERRKKVKTYRKKCFDNFSTVENIKVIERKEEEDKVEDDVECFNEISGADIEVEVGDTVLKLHSWILCQSSQVFRVMLQSDHFSEGRNNKIRIGNENVKNVVEFFQLLYPCIQKEFKNERTDFDEVLSLSQQYQVEWLTKKIESFIVENFDIKNERKIVPGLLLADQYDLPLLKLKLDEISYSDIFLIYRVLAYPGFKDLSPNSKRDILFKIVRNLLKDEEEIILKSLKKVLF